jgi:hypothetical protein
MEECGTGKGSSLPIPGEDRVETAVLKRTAFWDARLTAFSGERTVSIFRKQTAGLNTFLRNAGLHGVTS